MRTQTDRKRLVRGALCAGALACMAAGASAAEFVVDRGDDVSAGDGRTTLREAIALAEQSEGSDLIRFDPSLHGTTIELTQIADTSAGPSAFRVAEDITIDGGPGVTVVRDPAAGAFRLFYVSSTGRLTLRRVNLADGLARAGDGAVAGQRGSGGGGAAGLGGAILSEGFLRLESCELRGNAAEGGNGGGPTGGATSSGGGGGGGLAAAGSVSIDRNGGKGGGALGGNGGMAGVTPTVGNPGGFGGGGGGGAAGIRNTWPNAAGGDGGFGGGGGGGAPYDWTGFGGGAGAAAGKGGFGGGGGGAGAGTPEGASGAGGYGAGNGGNGNLTGNNGAPGGGGAGLGGALFNLGGTLEIAGCYIETNTTAGGAAGAPHSSVLLAQPGENLGGAVFLHNGTTSIRNTRFLSNTASRGADLLQLADAGASDLALMNVLFDEAVPQSWLPETINSGGFFASIASTGDGTLYVANGRFVVNWAQHAKGNARDSLTLVGSANLDGVSLGAPGGFLSLSVGTRSVIDSLPIDARGRANTAVGRVPAVRARVHATKGYFKVTITGLDLRKAIHVSNRTSVGPLDVPITLTFSLGAIRVPTWSGTLRFRQNTKADKKTKGVFVFKKDATPTSAFRILKAVAKPKDTGHVLTVKAVLAGLDGVPLALHGRDGPELELDLGPDTHAEIDEADLEIFRDGDVLTHIIDPGQNAPALKWLFLDARKGFLAFKTNVVDLGLNGLVGDPLEARIRIRFLLHTTQGPFPFSSTITIRRKSPDSGKWKH